MRLVKQYLLTTLLAATVFSSSAQAEWQWSKLPGKDKGRNIPPIERKIAPINSFSQVVEEWTTTSILNQRLCEPGIKLDIVEKFPTSAQKVFPKDGQTLVYSLSSNRGHQSRKPGEETTTRSTTITVIDAETKEVVAENELDIRFNGGIHDTIMSPNGRYIFAAGPHLSDYAALKAGDGDTAARLESFSVGGQNFNGEFYALLAAAGQSGKDGMSGGAPRGQSTMLKIDTLTLEPVALIDFVGSVHHGSAFGRYHKNPNMMWVDVFQQDADGAHMVMFDAETLDVVCAIRDESIGEGKFWTQMHMTPTGNYFMLQVTPVEPYVGAAVVTTGDPLYLPPNYIGVVDTESFEMVREIPVPPQGGGFTITDVNEEYIYNVSGGTDQVFKQNFENGALIWEQRTGMGPYGLAFNADHSEVWIADKGESVEYWGNSLTVVDDRTGKILTRINLPGYGVDHLILSPSGDEFWATSNASGQTYVVSTKTYEVTHTINMAGRGSTHGVGFIRYEDGGKPQLLQDSHEYIERTPHLDDVYRTYAKVEEIGSGSEAAAAAADPLEKGRLLFQADDGCQACHKRDGSGQIGPDIRGKSHASVVAAMESRRDMVNWQTDRQLTSEEIAYISKWLQSQK